MCQESFRGESLFYLMILGGHWLFQVGHSQTVEEHGVVEYRLRKQDRGSQWKTDKP